MDRMALAQRKRATITLDPDTSRLVDRAARELGLSRSEFVRRQLSRVLEQFRQHPKPRSAATVKRPLGEHGNEAELFRDIER